MEQIGVSSFPSTAIEQPAGGDTRSVTAATPWWVTDAFLIPEASERGRRAAWLLQPAGFAFGAANSV